LRDGFGTIVICDALNRTNRYLDKLGNDLPQHAIFTFEDFSFRNAENVVMTLESLRNCTSIPVVHTTLQGSRGMDFRMLSQPRVILAFEPTDNFTLR
jgi:hypothetical protein